MSRTRKILIGILVVFVIIQFFKPAKNISAAETPNDIFVHYPANDTLKQLIKTSCYDCHSNNTRYPWYSNIQPVAWFLNSHVEEGKSKINFAEFASYAPKKANHKLEELIDEVKAGDMPLKSYTLIHQDANLNPDQRKAIIQWVEVVKKDIRVTIQ